MSFRGRIVGSGTIAIVAAACSSFSGNGDTSDVDAGGASSDSGGGVADVQPVPGSAGPLGLAKPGAVRLNRGGTASLKVSLSKLSSDAARISVTGLPAGISAADIVIQAPATEGELEFTAAADVAEGAVAGVAITALSSDGVRDSAPLSLFVRGATGTLDTTYATAGTMDLGTSTFVHSKRYPNYVFVGTSNGGVRRFAADGALDNMFSLPITSGAQFSMAPDESVFVWDTKNLYHYSKAGLADASFGPVPMNGGQGAYMQLQIGPTATGSVVLAYDSILPSRPATQPVSSTGTPGTLTLIGVLTGRNANFAYNTGAMEAEPDGTFLLGVGTDGGRFDVIRLKSDASVDNTYASSAVSSIGVPVAAGSSTFVYGLRRTNDGTYVLGTSGGATYLTRRTNLGASDLTFGDGTATAVTKVVGSDTYPAFDIDSSGRPIVAYTEGSLTPGRTLTLIRFTRQGAVDTTFGTNGTVTLDLGASPHLSGIHIVDDERTLVVSTHDGDAFIQRIWL